ADRLVQLVEGERVTERRHDYGLLRRRGLDLYELGSALHVRIGRVARPVMLGLAAEGLRLLVVLEVVRPQSLEERLARLVVADPDPAQHQPPGVDAVGLLALLVYTHVAAGPGPVGQERLDDRPLAGEALGPGVVRQDQHVGPGLLL